MGLLLQSLKKSKMMKKAERVMCEIPKDFATMISLSDRQLAAFKDLYDAMNEMPALQDLLQRTTPEELVKIADSIACILDRRGTDYLPVALVSFPKPLK